LAIKKGSRPAGRRGPSHGSNQERRLREVFKKSRKIADFGEDHKALRYILARHPHCPSTNHRDARHREEGPALFSRRVSERLAGSRTNWRTGRIFRFNRHLRRNGPKSGEKESLTTAREGVEGKKGVLSKLRKKCQLPEISLKKTNGELEGKGKKRGGEEL